MSDNYRVQWVQEAPNGTKSHPYIDFATLKHAKALYKVLGEAFDVTGVCIWAEVEVEA